MKADFYFHNLKFIVLVLCILIILCSSLETDCKTKAFYCTDSRHYKICAVQLYEFDTLRTDGEAIECPNGTLCDNAGYKECSVYVDDDHKQQDCNGSYFKCVDDRHFKVCEDYQDGSIKTFGDVQKCDDDRLCDDNDWKECNKPVQ